MVTVLVIDLLKTITRTVTLFVTDSGCIHSWADFRGIKGCLWLGLKMIPFQKQFRIWYLASF